jgi:hypothetical protein
MSDSLRNDETLTTADIARGPTPRQVRSEVVYRGPVPDQAVNGGPAAEPIPLPASSANASQPGPVPVPPNAPSNAGPLFPDDELHNLRARWDQVQTSFVDEPRHAVEQADGLVANVVTRIAEQFANERSKLEEQWSKGDNVNTEDLRQALRRYRSFFDRLLSF